MSDRHSTLQRWYTKLAAATDPQDRADYQEVIDRLEAELELQRSHAQEIAGDAQLGAAVAGDVRGDVVAPLFSQGASGNYIAGVLNLYQQAPAEPQANYGEALQRYLSYLHRQYASLDLRGIDERPMDMSLSELYVALKLHEPPPDDLRQRGGLRGFMEKVRDRFLPSDVEPFIAAERMPRTIAWTEALRHPRLAVVGAPGSGKTTLLHYTTIRLCEVLAHDDQALLADLGLDQTPQPDRPLVPIFLPLRELGAYLNESQSREASGANPRVLLDCINNLYQRFDLDLPSDFFSHLCNSGRALLLLDGLDEVVQTSQRAEVSSIVRNFVQRYPNCRYVVTARVAAYRGDAEIGAGFQICTVDDLDAEQQQRFIANWSRSLHRLLYQLTGTELEHAAGRYTADLWSTLEQHERVRILATNPLLLTVVAVIFYNNYVLPEDRAALYEECVEVLLRGGRGKADRAAQQRIQYSGRPELSMGLGPKRELLAAVAYHMHQQGEKGTSISRADLITLLTRLLQERQADPREAAETFVAELPVHIGLLDEREPDRYRFSHLSFQEFLAARYIAESDRWDELLAHVQESWWREVILLCAGHLSQERCWRFLTQLSRMGKADTERAHALWLAATALAELERFKGEGSIRTQIQIRSLALFEGVHTTAAARVVCGRALAIVGDPRPGVCDVKDIPFVCFKQTSFVIGSTAAEVEAASKAWEAYYLEQGDKETAKYARQWPQNELNHQAALIRAFELARYPVTNAQWVLFMEAGGYDPDQLWWDAAGRAWLQRDDTATQGLNPWQIRERKDQPGFWEDARFGIARSNHPVVGISWYEASAFCRWLTLHLHDGYQYCLPSELEWEYAARGHERRVYAWGNVMPDEEHANFNQIYDGSTAVGCFLPGVTPEGVSDMTGTVWEWTGSAYRPYPYDPADGREHEEQLADKSFTLRGGSWFNLPFNLRASFRHTPRARSPLPQLRHASCPALSRVKHFACVLCPVL